MRSFDRTKRGVMSLARKIGWHAARARRTVLAAPEVRRAALAARRQSRYRDPQAWYLRSTFPALAVAALQVNWRLTERGAQNALLRTGRDPFVEYSMAGGMLVQNLTFEPWPPPRSYERFSF